jgi:hypothetical protein
MTLSLWEVPALRLMLMRELLLFTSKLNRQHQSMTEKSFRSVSADLLEVLQLSRLVVHQKSKFQSSRTESRMLFALHVLPLMRVLSQVVAQHFFLPAESSTL